MSVYQTPRLLLRHFRDEDIAPLFEIMGDADAMQYTYAAPSKAACAQRLRAYAELSTTLGYAPWTVLLRDTDWVIGWGGLNIDPFDPGWGIEIAYCFHPDHWGRGYATELVCAALDVGFGELAMETIVAFVHQENLGSARVLAKCGFRLVGYEPKLDRNHYAVQWASWRAQGITAMLES